MSNDAEKIKTTREIPPAGWRFVGREEVVEAGDFFVDWLFDDAYRYPDRPAECKPVAVGRSHTVGMIAAHAYSCTFIRPEKGAE